MESKPGIAGTELIKCLKDFGMIREDLLYKYLK